MESKVFHLSHKWHNILIEKRKGKNRKCFEKRIDFKLTIQSICVVFCSLCFIYQTQQLLKIYLSGQTVVDNRVEWFKYSKIQAITVCLPTIYSMKRYAQIYFKDSNDSNKVKIYQELEKFRIEVENKEWKESFKYKQEENYHSVFRQFHQDNLVFTTSMEDLFDKVSSNDILSPIYLYGEGFIETGKLVDHPSPS